MEGNMKVAIMTDVMKMDFTERPIPQPKDDEVLVKIVSSVKQEDITFVRMLYSLQLRQ